MPETLRWLVRVHGWLAWAAVVGLAIAVAMVWRRSARAAAAVTGAAVLGAAAFGSGALLHSAFQVKLRQRLFLASATLGWLFERKEHAVLGGLALLLCGAVALWAERLSLRAQDGAAGSLRRAGIMALGAALVLDALALAVSLVVGRRVGF